VWNDWIDQDQYSIHEQYICDHEFLDNHGNVPFGLYITDNYGPQYRIEEPYNPLWHKETAIEILEEEGYDALVDRFSEDYS